MQLFLVVDKGDGGSSSSDPCLSVRRQDGAKFQNPEVSGRTNDGRGHTETATSYLLGGKGQASLAAWHVDGASVSKFGEKRVPRLGEVDLSETQPLHILLALVYMGAGQKVHGEVVLCRHSGANRLKPMSCLEEVQNAEPISDEGIA